jgi:ABC-2 type transport system permease protein
LQNELSKYQAPFYKNWIIARRNFFTIVEVIFWPFIGLLSIGLMTSFLSLEENTVSFILLGAIAFSIVQVCQIDIAYVLLFDMWSKSIKHTFLAPVKGHHLILGSLLFGVLRSSIVFFILAIFSYTIFGFNFLKSGIIPLFFFLLGLFLNSAIIGILVCIAILTFGQRAEVIAWTLSGIMMFICGIYYPVSVLPSPLLALAKAIPLTYFLEYYRSFYGFEEGNLFLGYSLTIIYLFLGLVFLNKAIYKSRSTGILLRLSE